MNMKTTRRTFLTSAACAPLLASGLKAASLQGGGERLFFVGTYTTGNAGSKGIVAGAVLGIVASRWFSKKKADKHPAFAWHWAYWHLPDALSRMKATPPSYIRHMVG